MRHRRRLLIASVLAVLAVVIGGRAAAGLYVEALWFSHLGYSGYFWTLKGLHWLISLGFGLIGAAFLFANLFPLLRDTPQLRIRRRYGNIEISELFPRWYLTVGGLAISALFGWSVGVFIGGRLTLPLLQALNAPDWGTLDPIFSRDLTYYVFTLPVMSGIHVFGALVLFGTALLVLVGHALTGGLRFENGRFFLTDLARRHVAILGGLTLLTVAFGYWLGMQQLLWSGHGVTGSLGYADVHARFLGRRILIAASLLAAVATFALAYRERFRYAIASVIVLLVGTVVLDRAYPTIIQKIRVEPNELERESRYLAMNIALTRQAYALDRFEERSYPLNLDHRPEESAIARATSGLPLWDPRPLNATYNQFQGINPYYRFVDVDYDRYGEPGRVVQVAVAVREIDIAQLPPEARTWQNLHLSETYMHGLGLVMSPAAHTGSAGQPGYYVSGIPPSVAPDAPSDVQLESPAVYFGERTTQYVLVRADASPADPAPLGVPLDSFLRKLSFAWSFGDRNLLLSQELRTGTRIVYERTVRRRVARLAPFLMLDPDIYPVLADGHIVWVQDAYTATPNFPLSERVPTTRGPVGYLRNSVKVTVDALTGETTFYVADPEDPLVASYQNAFPSLFRPLDDMPSSLRRHLRYARELLLVQAQVLRAYHVLEPPAFYHQLDLWDLPVERYREGEEEVRPYYVVMPDPADGGVGLDYLLIFPFTARGRDNMRALLIARSDLARSPRVTLFRLPSEQVLGPRQVEVLIDQDPLISQQFTLWQQRGSRVIRGHLLVVPVDGTFLYVEPIFLEAESGGAAPSLSRVVVALAGRVAMGETVAGALTALATGAPVLAIGPDTEAAVPTSELERLRELINRADSALRRGDFAEFGRAWEEIRQLAQRHGEQATP